jgi:hypothetical protein
VPPAPRQDDARSGPRSRPRAALRSGARAVSLRVLFVGALTALAPVACSLDWAVRADPGEAPIAEGGADVTSESGDDDGGDASAPDAAEPDTGACEALAADLSARKDKARECQIAQSGQCTTTVDDECGCQIIVRTAGSAETTAYTSSVATFLAACGAPPAASCACPQLGLPASWGCLAKDATFACRPP